MSLSRGLKACIWTILTPYHDDVAAGLIHDRLQTSTWGFTCLHIICPKGHDLFALCLAITIDRSSHSLARNNMAKGLSPSIPSRLPRPMAARVGERQDSTSALYPWHLINKHDIDVNLPMLLHRPSTTVDILKL